MWFTSLHTAVAGRAVEALVRRRALGGKGALAALAARCNLAFSDAPISRVQSALPSAPEDHPEAAVAPAVAMGRQAATVHSVHILPATAAVAAEGGRQVPLTSAAAVAAERLALAVLERVAAQRVAAYRVQRRTRLELPGKAPLHPNLRLAIMLSLAAVVAALHSPR